MSIKLNNFVNIDIKYQSSSTYSSTKDTTVLVLFDNDENMNYIEEGIYEFASLDEVKALVDEDEQSTYYGQPVLYNKYYHYFTSFFNNNGRIIRLILVKDFDATTSEETKEEMLKNIIAKLEDKYIVIDSNLTYASMKDIARFYSTGEGTEQKLILGYCPNRTYLQDEEKHYQKPGIDKFCIKFGNEPYTPAKEPTACVAEKVDLAIACVANLMNIAVACVANLATHGTGEGEVNESNYTSFYFRQASSEGIGHLNDGEFAYFQADVWDDSREYFKVTEEGQDGVSQTNYTNYFLSRPNQEGAGHLKDATKEYYVADEWDSGYNYYNVTVEGEDGVNAVNYPNYYFATPNPTHEIGEHKDKDNIYEEATQFNTEIQYYTLTYEGNDYIPQVDQFTYKGIEMSIAAYLTNVNINRYDTVQDYAFTLEYYDENSLKVITVEDNDTATALINCNANFMGDLLDKIRNIGGNDSNGNSIINMFTLICLHQTLTESLTDLLASKIKYNQSGLTQICAVLNKELQKYVDNGYLTTNKVWTEEDFYYKGVLIIKKNTPLTLGYKYVILPFSTLSEEEKQEKVLPDIYVLIADSYGIRKINVIGRTY